MPSPPRACVECGNVRWIKAKGRCHACWLRLWRQEPYKATPSQWTPELDARMIALREAKITTAKIAEMLGTTKGAVIGRLHRQGLCQCDYDGPTTADRLNNWHAQLDAAIAETARLKSAGRYYEKRQPWSAARIAGKPLPEPLGERTDTNSSSAFK